RPRLPRRRSPPGLVAFATGKLERRGGRAAGGRVGASRIRGRAECPALLPFLPGGLQHHSRHLDAVRSRRKRLSQPVGPACRSGGRGGPGDQSPPPVLRQAYSKGLSAPSRFPPEKRWPRTPAAAAASRSLWRSPISRERAAS